MSTINDLKNKINDFKARVGRFSIGKSDFFGFMTDMVDKQKELADRQAADLMGSVDLSGTPAVYPAAELGWWKIKTNVASVDGGDLNGIEVKAGGQLVCDGVGFSYVEDPDLVGMQEDLKTVAGRSFFYPSFDKEGIYLDGGNWVDSSNWKSSKLNLMEGDIVEYSLHSTTNGYLVTFLDSLGVIISNVLSAAVPTNIVQSGIAKAPANTASVVVTTFAEEVHNSSCKILTDNNNWLILKSTSNLDPRNIVVDKNRNKDVKNLVFNTISEAIAIATGKDIIKIYGEYSNPYEEKSLNLPDGITIIGIGKPWIKGEQTADETKLNIENNSTIDANESCTLENLIISAKNMRYPIHADFSSGNSTKKIKNCKFIHYGNSEAYAYHQANVGDENSIFRAMSAWGGGTKAGDRVYIDGCYFESPMRAFSTHNNNNFNASYGASIIEVRNSEFISHGIDRDGENLGFRVPFHLQNLDSNTEDVVILDNVMINGYLCNQMSGTGITHKLICNTKGLRQIWNGAGSGYLLDEQWQNLDVTWFPIINEEITSFKNMNQNTLLRGKAVKLSATGIDLFTSSDNISDFFGILMQDTEPGKSGYVKYSGYLPWKYFDGVNYNIAEGDDVSVNATGDFVQNSTHVIAKAVDNNNVFLRY